MHKKLTSVGIIMIRSRANALVSQSHTHTNAKLMCSTSNGSFVCITPHHATSPHLTPLATTWFNNALLTPQSGYRVCRSHSSPLLRDQHMPPVSARWLPPASLSGIPQTTICIIVDVDFLNHRLNVFEVVTQYAL